MGKKVTLKQIAEIADVSLTTVHRVLNGKGGCSKEVEDKILNIAKEKGYYVSTVGKNKKIIENYIKNQLKEDMMTDKITIKEFIDPFKGC